MTKINASTAVMPLCTSLNCGKDFRQNLHRLSPNYTKGTWPTNIRTVPAFTVATLQKNTRVKPPATSGVYVFRDVRSSMFRRSYSLGEFPNSIIFTINGKVLKWKIPPETLNYSHYLPIFFDGLSEGEYPYNFIVENAIRDLVMKSPYKVLPVVPQLILPIKKALSTRKPNIIAFTLKCLQTLVKSCDHVGEALVPYYRQILPIVNLMKCKPRLSEDHAINPSKDLAFVIDDTLQTLERFGGPDAFINIKYMVPTYESCMLN